MIVNLPTGDALDATAKKLYFRAWHGIIVLLVDFDNHFPGPIESCFASESDSWADEREEYLEGTQDDLHAFLSITQQANELALKARIAAVSPYLLLLNNEVTFKSSLGDTEFASLRTLDAVDLPRAVGTLTAKPLGQAYIKHYGELRIRRNQYAHLGDTSAPLDPVAMCASMIMQYLELWPEGRWLNDRVQSTHSSEKFFDGKHWSPRAEIMRLLEYDRVLIPPTSFRKLFKVKKSAVRFGCHACQDDWAVGRIGPAMQECPTAYYDKSLQAMHCLICDLNFDAVVQSCPDESCEGHFAAAATAEFGAGKCFTCGK